jgi:hypothetical protein
MNLAAPASLLLGPRRHRDRIPTRRAVGTGRVLTRFGLARHSDSDETQELGRDSGPLILSQGAEELLSVSSTKARADTKAGLEPPAAAHLVFAKCATPAPGSHLGTTLDLTVTLGVPLSAITTSLNGVARAIAFAA